MFHLTTIGIEEAIKIHVRKRESLHNRFVEIALFEDLPPRDFQGRERSVVVRLGVEAVEELAKPFAFGQGTRLFVTAPMEAIEEVQDADSGYDGGNGSES